MFSRLVIGLCKFVHRHASSVGRSYFAAAAEYNSCFLKVCGSTHVGLAIAELIQEPA